MMDSFYVHLKLSNLKRVGSVFRVIEVCVFFILLSRLSFPVGEYAKSFFSILLSHRFVFAIGNAIVITLFANSRRDLQSDRNLKADPTPGTDSSSETIGKGLSVITRSKPPSVSTSTEGAKYGNKSEKRSVTNSPQHSNQSSARVENGTVQDNKLVKTEQLISSGKVCFKRSYSECLEVENYVKPRRILRRTVTEGCRGAASGCRRDGWEALDQGGGDGMSDEEFRVMVETFIAKQQRSLREEEKMTVFW